MPAAHDPSSHVPPPPGGQTQPPPPSVVATSSSALQARPQAGVAPVHVATLHLDFQLPAGLRLSSVGKKLLSYLLEVVLATITLGIGWLVWAAIVAAKGQTPARQLLGMRVVSVHDGRPLSWGQMVLMRGIIGAFVQGFAVSITLGVMAFMPVWDKRNQTVTDKVSASVVLDDPNRYYG